MLKRIFLFLMTNIAVILVLTVVFAILENVFWLKLDLYGFNYTSIIIYSAIVWFSWAFISLFISKWIAKKAYKIQLFTKQNYDNFNLKQKIVWDVVEDLSQRNHIKMPEVWFYISKEANAFATWRSKNNSLVAVSSWLLDLMEKDAIEWVIAHEMAHILNWDMVTMTLIQWVLNTFVIAIARIITNLISSSLDENLSGLAYFAINIALQILFWILASMILMKFSRYREFRADEGSARFVWKDKMIAWLEALKNTKSFLQKDERSLAAMKINNKGKKWFLSLFSSHPDLDDRINALKELNI